jgi:hypothetical protein
MFCNSHYTLGLQQMARYRYKCFGSQTRGGDIFRSSYKPIATKHSGSRNQPKRCLRAPQNMPSRTWQLASNVAIIYPHSRSIGNLPKT